MARAGRLLDAVDHQSGIAARIEGTALAGGWGGRSLLFHVLTVP